jgi:hypothetical protein
MEAVVDGGGGNGIFAATIDSNHRMVAVVSTSAAQLTTTAAIAATTIGQRCHCGGCHCIIVPPSHHPLRQQQLPLTKTIITMATINCCFRQQ